jgi:hypothetical protein
MDQNNRGKKRTGWDKPLSNLGKRRYRGNHPINGDRLTRSGDPSLQKLTSNPGSQYTEGSIAAHPAASNPSRGPTGPAYQQAASPAFESGVNPAMPRVDPLTLQSQARYLPMRPFGLPSSASVALTYPHGDGDRSDSPYTGISVNAGSHNIPQPELDAPDLAYVPAATGPFRISTYAETPSDHSQSGSYPRAAEHLCVPQSLLDSRFDANAPYEPLRGSSRPPTAPYDVQIPAASCLTLASQSSAVDPDPYLYIDSLIGYYSQNKRLPDDDTVRTAYFRDKKERRTILAMRLAHFKHDDHRIATKCVHSCNLTPAGWLAFHHSNGGSSGRDHPSEKEKRFMIELKVEDRLPFPQELKRVWRNSYSFAFSERSSKKPNLSLPPKDDLTDWDAPKRAFQLTAGFVEYHLRNTNPGSQIATVRLSKTDEAFDKLSYPVLVSLAESFTLPAPLTQRQIAILTGDLMVTTSVPNLTVGSVDLNKAYIG